MSDLDRTLGTTDVASSADPATNAAITADETQQAPRDDTQANETDAAEAGSAESGATEAGAAHPGAGSAEARATDADAASTGTASDGTTTPPAEVWRLSAVAGVHMELPSANPEIVIHESQHPWRELRIPVGMAEGTAIAYAFRGIPTPRPLTHELFTEILERHGVSVEAVRITVRRGQLFHAELDTMGPRGRQVVPCRPSDAIALLLRQHMPTPLLVADWVFADAGVEDSGTH
jgi:bifunctional DNase/RNase